MKCEMCDKEHNGRYGSGRFCDAKCARGFSTKLKRKEINEIVSIKNGGGLTKQQRAQRKIAEKHASYIREIEAKSLLEISARTARKILIRMKLPCSNCGWFVEGVGGDLHHIKPRGKGGSDEHKNLAYICPNCHRLAHTGRLNVEKLISFQDLVGDDWKKFYFTKDMQACPSG